MKLNKTYNLIFQINKNDFLIFVSFIHKLFSYKLFFILINFIILNYL